MDQLDLLTFIRIIKTFTLYPDGVVLSCFDQLYESTNRVRCRNSEESLGQLEELGFLKRKFDENGHDAFVPTDKAMCVMRKLYIQSLVQSDGPVRGEKIRDAVEIERLKIPDFVKETGRCPVKIIKINDPANFWFQINDADHSEKLEELSRAMEDFYRKTDSYRFRISCLYELCNPVLVAAPYKSAGFYRAMVLSTPSEGKVQILYPDYGNIGCVSVMEVYKLVDEFRDLPWQGICATEVKFTSICDTIDIETMAAIQRIEDVSAVFKTQFKPEDEYWPAMKNVEVELVDSNNQLVFDRVKNILLYEEDDTQSEVEAKKTDRQRQ